MKKLISIFLAVAVAFSLSACGNQKEKILITAEQETAETSEPIVQQESNSHESGINIVILSYFVISFSPQIQAYPLTVNFIRQMQHRFWRADKRNTGSC